MKPKLSDYSWIVVNSSGGKDSQTALRAVVRECKIQEFPLSRVVVSHQCLGDMEWEGTFDLVKKQTEHHGLRLEVTKYRNKHGDELPLLDYVRKRGKWPDNKNRYCTSDFKRGPGRRVITKIYKEDPGDVLNVFGFRAEESPARSKKINLAVNKACSTKSRTVVDWLPIHDWTETEVWADIHASGVPYHQAYELGMPRLSCVFCIFAPKAALMVAGKANPRLLDKYCKVEEEIGHDFQHKKPIHKIRQAIFNNEKPEGLNGNWNM